MLRFPPPRAQQSQPSDKAQRSVYGKPSLKFIFSLFQSFHFLVGNVGYDVSDEELKQILARVSFNP